MKKHDARRVISIKEVKDTISYYVCNTEEAKKEDSAEA